MNSPALRRRRSETLAAAAVLLALVLLAFFPVVTGRRSFFHLDLYYEHLPVWEATQKALLAGTSPFWLDGEYCGHPPLFHQEAPLFYPLTAPLLLTGAPVHRLSDAFSLFHYWLAGIAVFLLVRELTGSAPAGLFGGAAWMLSSRMVQTALWSNAVAVSALVPLVLYGVARIGRGARRSGVLWTAIAGGLALAAARPHVLLAAAPIVAGVGVALVATAPDRRRAVRDVLLAAVLALALGAPSVAPTAALLPDTSRGQGSLGVGGDPRVLSRGRSVDMVFLPTERPGRWPEAAAYPGLVPALFFLAAVVLVATRAGGASRAILAGCLAGGALGLAFAFGSRGPYRLVSGWPLLRSFRVPERFLFSWSLGIALAAGIALGVALARVRRPAVLASVALAGLAVDLVPHALASAPTADPAVYAVVPDVVAPLSEKLGRDASGFPKRFFSLAMPLDVTRLSDAERVRVLRKADSLKGAAGMRFGLEAVGGAGPSLARTEELVLWPNRRSFALGAAGAVVLSSLGADGRANELAPPRIETVEPLPRAFVVPASVVVAPEKAVAAALSPGIDPRRTVVLEEGEPRSPSPRWSDADASAKLLFRTPTRLVIEARSPDTAYLVLLDSWEAGWRATVDGAAAEVLRADGAFRAVRVGAGTHRVEFAYAPRGLREGLGLGAAGVLGLLLAARRLRDASPAAV